MKHNERARVAPLDFVFKMNFAQRKKAARTDPLLHYVQRKKISEPTSPLSVPPSRSSISLLFAILLLLLLLFLLLLVLGITVRCLLEPHGRRLEVGLET